MEGYVQNKDNDIVRKSMGGKVWGGDRERHVRGRAEGTKGEIRLAVKWMYKSGRVQWHEDTGRLE